jgi:hypothetical protein
MFEQLTGELTAANQVHLEIGRKAVKAALVEFMAGHPEVASLKWQGAAPSFNDGDPCYFRIHEPEVQLRAIAADGEVGGDSDPDEPDNDEIEMDEDEEDVDEEEEDDDDGDYLDSYSLPETPAGEQLKKDMDALHAVLEAAEDAVIDLFGDSHEVTVGPDGQAKVEEYYE